MNGKSKYTVWHYVGCGCGVLLLLGALAIGGMVWFGMKTAKGFTDPDARAAKVRDILGYDELPEGYYPGFGLSIPFVMDMAMVGDRELPTDRPTTHIEDDDLFENGGFMFFRMRRFGGREDFQGETDYQFDAERTIREGEIEAGGGRVEYAAKVGRMKGRFGSIPSIAAEMEIDCDDSHFRFASWFERYGDDDEADWDEEVDLDEDAETSAEAAEATAAVEAPVQAPVEATSEEAPEDYTGTPADEQALRAFLDHFDLCRRR